MTLVSCARGGVPPVSVSDSAGVRITAISTDPSALREWTPAPSPILTLTGAESGDSAAFARVGAVRWLTDGRLVVADLSASRLLVFDSTGRFVRALGRRGEGPGEFRNLTSVSVLPGDTVVTFDASLRRLSVWHADRGFIRGVAVGGDGQEGDWPADAWWWHDSLIVVMQLSITPRESVAAGPGVRRWPTRARLILRDRSGRVVKTSPVFNGTYTGLLPDGDTRLPFSNEPFAVVARDRVFFGSGDPFVVSYLNGDFVWAGDLRWPGMSEPLTAAEVDQVRLEAVALAATRVPMERLRNAFSANFAPEILPRTRPAIGRLLVAPDGRLWVGRFEATRLGSPLQKAADRWTVVEADGRPVARVRLSDGARLEAVRGSRLALVLRDSLDVQTVAVYELQKP